MPNGMLPPDVQIQPGATSPEQPGAMPPEQPGAMPPEQAKSPQRDYRQNPLGPQDAQSLEMFNISATKLIHSSETRDKVLKRIGISQKGPIDDIAELSIVIVDRIDQQIIKDTGQPVDNAVKIQGANSVVGQIIEIAEASGKVPKFNEDEKAVAYTYAVQKYTDRMIQRGEITKEELTQYTQEAEQLGQQLQGGGETAPMADTASAPVTEQPAESPTQPTQTMSQKLAQGGILDGI